MREHRPASAPLSGRPIRRLRWRPVRTWRELLVGRCPETLLARIVEGDPLRLRELCALRIRDAAVFVDADRVHLLALTHVVFLATTDGPPRRRRALIEAVDLAVVDAAAEGALGGGDTASSSGGPSTAPASIFATFARPLGLDAGALRRGCDAFNACDLEERRAFFALVVDRGTLEDAAAALGITAVAVAQRARRALDAAVSACSGLAVERTLDREPTHGVCAELPREEELA